jgi:hypothetical protein
MLRSELEAFRECGTFGSVLQEVLALTLIVAGGKPAEIAAHFKEAFQRYTTASGSRAPRR